MFRLQSSGEDVICGLMNNWSNTKACLCFMEWTKAYLEKLEDGITDVGLFEYGQT